MKSALPHGLYAILLCEKITFYDIILSPSLVTNCTSFRWQDHSLRTLWTMGRIFPKPFSRARKALALLFSMSAVPECSSYMGLRLAFDPGRSATRSMVMAGNQKTKAVLQQSNPPFLYHGRWSVTVSNDISSQGMSIEISDNLFKAESIYKKSLWYERRCRLGKFYFPQDENNTLNEKVKATGKLLFLRDSFFLESVAGIQVNIVWHIYL